MTVPAVHHIFLYEIISSQVEVFIILNQWNPEWAGLLKDFYPGKEFMNLQYIGF